MFCLTKHIPSPKTLTLSSLSPTCSLPEDSATPPGVMDLTKIPLSPPITENPRPPDGGFSRSTFMISSCVFSKQMWSHLWFVIQPFSKLLFCWLGNCLRSINNNTWWTPPTYFIAVCLAKHNQHKNMFSPPGTNIIKKTNKKNSPLKDKVLRDLLYLLILPL